MGKVNTNNYGGKSLPPLRADDLEGANAAVLTITEAAESRIPDYNAPGGARMVMRVNFAEFPDKVFYMNPAGVTACVEEFGEYTEQWAGKSLPLVVRDVLNPVTRETKPALHVAPREEWGGILDGTGEVADAAGDEAAARTIASARKSTTARKSTAKRGSSTRK